MGKAELFLPIAFWSEVVVQLDNRIENILTKSGFGEVTMTVKIHKEKVFEMS
jgi:hypothetical protein